MSAPAVEWGQGEVPRVPELEASKPVSLVERALPHASNPQCATDGSMGRTVRPGSAIESGLTFGPALSPVSDLACDESSLASDAAALPAARLWRALSAAFSRIWASFELRRATQRRRSLRVVETVTMGEKRFVAIVQVEGARFLIGGGGVSLLSRLDASEEFASVLSQQSGCQAAESQACSFKVAR